ncbi:MAG: hypothetical protein ABSB55_08075 [Acidimicrobiales bacterium]
MEFTLSVMVDLPSETDSTPFFFPRSPITFSVLDVEFGFTLSTRWTLDCLAIAAFVALRTELVVLTVADADAPRAAETRSTPVPNASARTRHGVLGRAKDLT